MNKIILITGSGLVATRLATRLIEKGYEVRFLSRKKNKKNYFFWDIENNLVDQNAFTSVSHIVHLAGENVANGRWTHDRKKSILSSRVDSARLILKNLREHHLKIESFISASAIGYYGIETTENIYSEDDEKGHGFLSDVCEKWEAAADELYQSSVVDRVVKIRIGIVLSNAGGALDKIKAPIKYYAGAALGTGCQYMPWIHIDDLCGIFEHAIENKNIEGVFNAVSPGHITHKEFMDQLAKSMHRLILWPNIPRAFIELIFGEFAISLLEGSRVSSKKIIDEGFTFVYSELDRALKNL